MPKGWNKKSLMSQHNESFSKPKKLEVKLYVQHSKNDSCWIEFWAILFKGINNFGSSKNLQDLVERCI